MSCLSRVIAHPCALGIPGGNCGKLTQRTGHPILVPTSNFKHCHSEEPEHGLSLSGLVHTTYCSQLRLACPSSRPKSQAATYITISETVSMLTSATRTRTRGFIDAGEVPETWRACRACRAKNSRPVTLHHGESTVDDIVRLGLPFGQSVCMLDYSSRSSDRHGSKMTQSAVRLGWLSIVCPSNDVSNYQLSSSM